MTPPPAAAHVRVFDGPGHALAPTASPRARRGPRRRTATRGAARGLARWVLSPLWWLAGGALAGLVLAIALPLVVGWRPYTVLTGSMRPVLQPGDIVMDEYIDPLQARRGDIVTFPDPSRGGRLVTHRVTSVTASAGEARFVTKGDDNAAVERWDVALDDRIGRVVYRIPALGHLATLVARPLAVVLLLLVPAVLLGAISLVEIWRPTDEGDDDGGARPGPVDPGATR